MAFADPQSVTVHAVAHSLPRISSGVNSGAFGLSDSTDPDHTDVDWKLSVSHQYGRTTRRVLRLDASYNGYALLGPSQVKIGYNPAVYLVTDMPPVGMTVAEQKYIVDGFVAYLSASSGAKVTQLLGGEN